MNALQRNTYTEAWNTIGQQIARPQGILMISAPTPEPYLPRLPILALWRENEPINFSVQGFDGGSESMLAVQIGQ